MAKPNFLQWMTIISACAVLCLPYSSMAGAADEYAIISKKNLFRPDRSEWVVQAEEKPDPAQLELFGTIIVGDRRSALIYQDKRRAKGKLTRSSRSKNRGKKVRKKAELYHPGDSLDGYVVSEIDEKQVVLDYYGDKEILYLYEGKQPPKGDYTPLVASRPQPRVPPKQKPVRQKSRRDEQRKQAMERDLAAGKVPAALADVMSQEQLKKLLKFNRDLMKELRNSGGRADRYVIKERIEAFRERFLESM